MEGRIRIGASSCLLGEKVRYDGGHKLDRFLTETLGSHFDFLGSVPRWNTASPCLGRRCTSSAIPTTRVSSL
jgi:hypothetical protein